MVAAAGTEAEKQSVGVRNLAPIWTSAVEWLRRSTDTMLVFLTSYLRPPGSW